MHELSLADDVIRIVTEQVDAPDLSSVRIVRVAVGEMMMVEKDTFVFAYNALKENTPLENSQLELLHIPLKAICGACGNSFTPEKLNPHCPECGGQEYRVIEGDAMYVREVEIDDSDRSVEPQKT